MDTPGRVGGYCQTRLIERWWPVRLQPGCDELLSSYLVRSAQAHGLTPSRLASLYMPGLPIWARDIDLCGEPSTLGMVASSARLDVATVRAMTLVDLISNWTGKDQGHYGRTNWILSLGVHGRSYPRYGLQFCPECLQTEVVFRRTWRLAFVFACPVHQRVLEDRCTTCRAPVVLRRSRFPGALCHHCGSALTRDTNRNFDVLLPRALQVQARYLQLVQPDTLRVGAEELTPSQLFTGLTILLKVLRDKSKFHASLFRPEVAAILSSCQSLCFAPVLARMQLCALLLEMLDDWPHRFLELTKISKMTQVEFNHHGRVPSWLRPYVDQLPVSLRSTYAYPRSILVKRVRTAEALGGIDCREQRARELLTAVRRWNGI